MRRGSESATHGPDLEPTGSDRDHGTLRMPDSLLLTGERFFLSPVCLVPNGRAHLGHVSGPLLRTDVVRRHLLRADATALAINTSDAHESHVLVQAHREGASPDEVASRYHEQIRADLLSLQIEWDDFIDPLDDAWNDAYRAVVTQFVEGIVASGGTSTKAVQVPYVTDAEGETLSELCPQIGDPAMSGWLSGTCPGCGEQLVGFFCEQCGGCFEPAQMKDPTTAHFSGSLALRPRPTLHLDARLIADELVSDLARGGVPPAFRRIVLDHLKRSGTDVRLTVPSRWGIPWSDGGVDAGEVIWSYSALLIGCHITAGERFAELTGAGNPFAVDSGTTCAIAFGIDNTIPYLFAAQSCMYAHPAYKPVEAFLTNHFALLDGEKFSTSRRHVIWAGDLVARGGAYPDIARLLLCLTNPELRRVDFDTAAFARNHVSLVDDLARGIASAVAHVDAQTPDEIDFDLAVLHRLEAELVTQSAHLRLDAFQLAAAAGTVRRWIDSAEALHRDASSAMTWLYGTALLAEPFMPGLARLLWRDVGQEGPPRIKGFRNRRVRLASNAALEELARIDAPDLVGYASWVAEPVTLTGG